MHSHMYKHKTQNQTHIGSTQMRPFIGNVIWNKLLNDSAFCKMTVLLLWLKEAKEESAQDLLCVCVFRDRNCITYIGRQILYHWAPWKP